jgi:hypothetical protein
MRDSQLSEPELVAAFCAFMADAPTEVRPTEVAQRLATEHPVRSWLPASLTLGLRPAATWVALMALLLLALLAGLLAAGSGLRERAIVVAPSVPPNQIAAPGLTGTWSDRGAWQAVLVLHSCSPGEICGRFELTVDHGGGPRCVYTLEHRPADGDTYAYWTAETDGSADAFHCAYDYRHVVLHVRPKAAGSVLVWQEGVTDLSWTLSPVSDRYER